MKKIVAAQHPRMGVTSIEQFMTKGDKWKGVSGADGQTPIVILAYYQKY